MSETMIVRNHFSFSVGSSSSRISSSQTNPKLKKTFLQGKFEHNLQFFLYTLAYTVSIDSFTFMYKVGQYTTELNLVQYFLAYVFVGIPLYYMQMFLGQYTQVGMVHLRHMVPFGHGVIYTALITVFLHTIKYGMFFGDFCLYFLLAWQKHLPWTICHNQEKNRMWGKCVSSINYTTCGGECLSNVTYTSAYLYYVGTYLRVTPNDTANFSVDVPTIHRTIGSVTAWILTFGFTVFVCPRWPKVLFALVYEFYILLTFLNMGTLSTTGGMKGVRHFFKGTWEKIGSLMAWCRSISIVIHQLRLSHAFIILNASKLKPKSSNAGLLTVGFCAVTFISNLLCVIFFQSCIGMLVRRTNSSSSNPIEFGVEHDRGRLFVLIPQSLGYLTVPQIWSLQYFMCAMSIILANLATHIHTLHSSLADVCPSAKKYQNYIILGYCVFACIMSICILGESNFIFCNYFEEIVLALLEMINISYFAILVFWIYGVRRLGDDICFTFGVQPTKFWQITWYLMPFITSCATYYEYNFHMPRASVIFSKFLISTLVLVWASPIPILVFVEIFKHMKSRNLTGLFRPTYMWGPPDPEERHKRLSFNPRKETTYNYKMTVCKHNCLLHNKTFKNLIEPESRCTQSYLDELKNTKLRK